MTPEAIRAAVEAKLEPVAWMWQYIGKEPIGAQRHPCARSIREMDPHNPPFPNHWKPLYPLYACPGDVQVDAKADEFPQVRNRGLLQAAKQALSALKRHARIPVAIPGGEMLWEARSYLEPAIKWEEDFRAAMSSTPNPELPNTDVHLADDCRTARNSAKESEQ